MSVLSRKLVRDLRGSRWVLLVVVVIISVGTGGFLAMGSAQRILESSQSAYYAQCRFADFWVDVKKAPLTAGSRTSPPRTARGSVLNAADERLQAVAKL